MTTKTKPNIEKLLEIQTFVLPSYWASYLINNDASELTEQEKRECDNFLIRESLQSAHWFDCSEEWFSWSNDAGTVGGNVAEYNCYIY